MKFQIQAETIERHLKVAGIYQIYSFLPELVEYDPANTSRPVPTVFSTTLRNHKNTHKWQNHFQRARKVVEKVNNVEKGFRGK